MTKTNRDVKKKELALHGGPKAVQKPLGQRGSFGVEEKEMAIRLFDEAIEKGQSFGYNGSYEQAYCEQFADMMGGGYADAVNSGSSALYVALRALELKPFSEIIVGPKTDAGGMMPVALNNCIPVIPDAAYGSYNTNAEQIEKMISPHTSAIIVAHIGGEPTDVDNIVTLAKSRQIPVIEDCAQAHYAKLHGKMLGTFGDMSIFSMMNSKHHCTGGQGGLVFTQSETLYWKARQYSDRGKPFGIKDGGTNNTVASLNLNLNDLAAAIGIEQLKKLPHIVKARQNAVARLTPLIKDLPSVTIPSQIEGAQPSWWFWRLGVTIDAIECDDKFPYLQALRAEGVPLNPDYPAMPHLRDWYVHRRVFVGSEYPWVSPDYKGRYKTREQCRFECKNALAATATQYNLQVKESWDDEAVAMVANAYKKVDAAYAK